MALQIEVAVRKRPKYGLSLSGDQVQVVERGRGGISVILADGQGSGAAARRTALLVANRVAALISEGARDGPTARAVHDLLYAQREGKVSATLTIVSADLHSRTVVVSQNGPDVVLVRRHGVVEQLLSPYGPIGVDPQSKPFVHEFPIAADTLVVALSDGVLSPDRWNGRSAVLDGAKDLVRTADPSGPEALVAAILELAEAQAEGRPRDDMSVCALCVSDGDGEGDKSRVFALRLPA